MVFCFLLLGGGLALAAGGAPTRQARAQPGPAALAAALACDARRPSPAFALTRDPTGRPALAADASEAPAALNLAEPRLAVTCAAVFANADAPSGGDPLALPPGEVTFSVSGPGLIVEQATQIATVACGVAAQPGSCRGGVATEAAPESVAATAALTIHVVLLPGALLPPAGSGEFINVNAAYRGGDGGVATAASAIDLGPPLYQIVLTPGRAVADGGANDGVAIGVRLRHALPSGCSVLGAGPYLLCAELSAEPGDSGAEPGTIVFTTDLGAFPNGEQRIAADCGDLPAASARLTVPGPGGERPFALSCTDVAVRLSPMGRAGEVTIRATFTGALTGASASGETALTLAPRPATLPLAGGCAEVFAPQALPAAAPVTLLVESVQPASAVVSVWRRDPATGVWQAGFLRGAAAPLDFTTLDPGERVILCVDGLAQFPLG